MRKLFAPLLVLLALLAVMPAAFAAEEEQLLSGQAQLLQEGGLLGERSGISLFGLSRQEQQLYDLLSAGIQAQIDGTTAQGSAIDISAVGLPYDADGVWLLQEIFADVANNHPGWIALQGRFRYGSSGSIITSFYPTFDESYAEKKAPFEAAIAKALTCVDAGMTDLEKVIAVHDYLVSNCAYNWTIGTWTQYDDALSERPGWDCEIYSAYGALVDGDAVCQGYAQAFKLLMDELGIGCKVTTSESMNHAWNLVQLGNDWYHVDVTWDDSTPNKEGGGDYTYFLFSDASFNTAENGRGAHYGWVEFEECSSTAYESGYAFNVAQTLMYRWSDGEYYYIDTADWEDANWYATGPVLFKGALEMNGEEEKLAYIGGYYYSALWLEDQLFYADGYYSGGDYTIQIMRCDLATGAKAAVGEEILFTQTAYTKTYTVDGEEMTVTVYPDYYDAVGLRLDANGDHIQAVSSTRREVLLSVKVADHPISWDEAELDAGESAEILGVENEDGMFQAGVLLGEEWSSKRVRVLAAVYRSGKMIDLRWAEMAVSAEGLQVVDLGETVPKDCTVCLMVTGEDYIPVCGEYRPL